MPVNHRKYILLTKICFQKVFGSDNKIIIIIDNKF